MPTPDNGPPPTLAQTSPDGATDGGPTAPLDSITHPTTQNRTRALEHRMGDSVRAALPPVPAELTLFILKQGWACLFGGLLLIAIIATKLVWQSDWPLHRTALTRDQRNPRQ